MKTQTISRILVPTDFSETAALAVEHAAYMAVLCNAELVLLHLIAEPAFVPTDYETVTLVNTDDETEVVISARLNAMKKKLENEYGISVMSVYDTGRIGSGIAETAQRTQCDLIIMGTHGASGLEEFFPGSNAHRTASAAPCPVITLKANAKRIGFANIVMPIDNSEHSRQKTDHVI